MTKDHRESKRNEHACTKATERTETRSQATATSGSGQFTMGQVDLRASTCRSDACRYSDKKKTVHLIRRGAKAEKIPAVADNATTHASWFATQNTSSRQRLDNQADHRTFTCVTQTLFNLIVWCFGVMWNRWDALKFKTIGRRIMYNYENCENWDNGKNCAN